MTIPKSEAFGYQGAVYLGKAFNPFEDASGRPVSIGGGGQPIQELP